MKRRFMLFGKEDIMTRDGSKLYLKRWIIFRTPWLSLYLHQFHLSDDPVPHDHPWDFITLPLVKGYKEHFFYMDPKEGWSHKLIKRKPFVPAYRRGEDAHWVELHEDTKPWSLCILFKRRRAWGFVEEDWANKHSYIWTESDAWLEEQRTPWTF